MEPAPERIPVAARRLASAGATLDVEAAFLGERIDVRSLRPRLASHPVVVEVGERGWAAVFRYGAVVTFRVRAAERARFLADLESLISHPYSDPEREPAVVRVDPGDEEGIVADSIVVTDAAVERLQIVAEILAKSVVLSHYEEAVAAVFGSVEPLAAALGRGGGGGLGHKRRLLKHLAETIGIQHRMVGRVEVLEKPDLLWERPDLERLYLRLEDEYEIRERNTALERKLALINKTAETSLEMLQTRSSLRVEWYIVILIVVEIVISLYELFAR